MTQLEALEAIARRNGNVITPKMVIDEARDERSVLHGAFTWDDTKAAHKWRVYEAQQLIRRYKVEVKNGDTNETTFAFVGLSSDRNGCSENNPYRLASEVAKSDDLARIAERDAIDQLNAVKRRYDHLKRLSSIWDAIDSVSKRI